MITATNVLVLLAMLVGTAGIVLPVLPGLLVVWLAFLVWTIDQPDRSGWVVFAVATVIYAVGLVAQYVYPGRRLRSAGVQNWVIAVSLAVAVVGLFVIPVVGAPVGFIAAIYLLELIRRREHRGAWTATKKAVRAVGLSVGIELVTALTMITVWGSAVWARAN
ncbi:DUF456 domain-containing protein [Humibacillus sp. DSM 29435]|uniref:DUF456 domain-containing protein n=1 Tax=Humibacillus sp. DSM 29435 TaxID=1869167 RepID=UPI0009F1F057|nr:DUF456 domain-containing protein [Humibacillus sp. DSM 29435]